MKPDQALEQARRFAPVGVALAIVTIGWLFVIRPTADDATRAAADVEALRQRLVLAQAAAAQPVPPRVTADPSRVFERQVAGGHRTSELLEQLARLAATAGASNLLMETGDAVVPAAPGAPDAPHVTPSGPAVDPRLALFSPRLVYTPVLMRFDAEYGGLGDLLWQMRDLPALTEIRTVKVSPTNAFDGRVHVFMSLYVYAAPGPSVIHAGGAGGQP